MHIASRFQFFIRTFTYLTLYLTAEAKIETKVPNPTRNFLLIYELILSN